MRSMGMAAVMAASFANLGAASLAFGDALKRVGGPMIQSVFHPDHQKNRRDWTATSRYKPHQGTRERVRRLRNIERHGAPG